MTKARATWALVWTAALLAVACGDEEPSACGSDADCKGDRICVAGECVDPGGGNGSGSSGGDAGSSGGGSDDGGNGGGSSGGSGGPVDDDELEAACMMDCIAKQDADCEEHPISLDQCRAQCLVVDEQNQGYCLAELRARYDCYARGGYTCVNGYPQPESTCIAEQTALSECMVDAPCRGFCDSTGGGCGDDTDACLDACLAEVETLEASFCQGEYNLLLNCWAGEEDAFSCDGGRPEVGTCGRWVARTGDCVGRRGDDCDGYCWAAEALGCGDGCLEDCTAKSDDVACGYRWDRVIDCAVDLTGELELSCNGDTPEVSEACASEMMEWEGCMGG